MEVTVIGYQYREGTSKKTNKPYAAFFVSVTYPVNQYTGVKAEELFVSKEAAEGIVPEVGKQYLVQFTRNGFVSSFTPVVNGK